MDKLQPAYLPLPSRDKFIKSMMTDHGITKKNAIEQYRRLKQDKVFMNDVYQVNVSTLNTPMGDGVVHLSIKRRDKKAIHDWRDFQEIKNQLLGEECEAVELYPAQSRLVDTANQYHLWGIPDPTWRFPFGYTKGEISYESKGGVVQRKQGESA